MIDKRYLWIIATLVFTACGGGGGDTPASNPSEPNIDKSEPKTSTPDNTEKTPTAINTMTIGVPYTMKKGQTIIREEEPTVVVIETTTDTLVTTATLESGKARIE